MWAHKEQINLSPKSHCKSHECPVLCSPIQYDFISFFLLLGHKGLEANDGPWRGKSVLIILMLLQPCPTQVPGIQVDWEAFRQVCSVILNIINQALCFNVSNFPELPLKSKFGSILDPQQAATDFLCIHTYIDVYACK